MYFKTNLLYGFIYTSVGSLIKKRMLEFVILLTTLLMPNVWGFFSLPHQPIFQLSRHQLGVPQFILILTHGVSTDPTG